MTSAGWIRLGSAFLLTTAVGHLFFVEFAPRYFLGSLVVLEPPDLLERFAAASYDWGIFGSTSGLRAVTGFSVWVSVSLGMTALWALWSLDSHRERKTASAFGATVSIFFGLVAAICFILPPVLGGLGGTICYTRAFWLERGHA